MSDIEKKVEEPVVAPETTPVVAEPAAVEAAPATTEPTEATETPAVEEPSTETATAVAEPEEVKEIVPISEGTLGYKGPGLLKSLRFSKKFFWFGNEAIAPKHLANYLRGEKPEVGNKNGAWAAHTGKGLLFFSKAAGEKTTPGGIINLAEISDASKEGTVEFFFNYQGHKHTFQAGSAAERDSWVASLGSAATEAKANAEGVTSSEAYKEHLAALNKPSTAAAPVVTKKEEKAEDKAEKKEEKKEEKAAEAADKKEVKEEKKEEKADRKSRSQSRKRTSIFGGFNKKKEEHKATEPEAAAAPVETPAAAEATEVAPVEPAAPTEVAPVETAEATEVTPVAAAETPKPATSKRTSIFGQLQSRFSNKKEETAPAVPAKDDAVPETSDAAPVIPAVETETPLSADINSPATVPTETTTPEVAEAAPAETTPKAEKRKSALPFGLGGKNSPGLLSRFGTKKNKKSSTDEPTAPVTSEKVPEATAEEPVTEIPVTNGEVEPAPATQTTPIVSATA